MATIKVRFAATIEIDVEEWALEYGLAPTSLAVQQDVRAAILENIRNMPVAPISVSVR